MNILAIDTSTGHCSVALLTDNGRYEMEGQQPATQAEKLFFLVADVLAQAGLSYAALDRIAITTGPGSFTGVRIGLAAAKGMALAAHLPLIGITSLEALAWEALPAKTPILAVMDARRGQVYAQLFDANAQPLKEAVLVRSEEIAAYVGEGECVVAGNGATFVEAYLPSAEMLKNITIPRAAIIAQAAQQKTPADKVEAFYIREPDAKVKAPADAV